MKEQLIRRFCLSLLSILLVSSSLYAQTDTTKNTLPAVTVTGTTIDQKVWAGFQKSFKNAVDPRWYKIAEDYLVKFIMENQEQSALFNKRGTLIYHITYGTEKNLPTDIRRQIKSIYVDYKITSAFSIKESDRFIWVVNLENEKNMLVVKVEDGEIEEAKNYKKST
jgi:hypothetical protein